MAKTKKQQLGDLPPQYNFSAQKSGQVRSPVFKGLTSCPLHRDRLSLEPAHLYGPNQGSQPNRQKSQGHPRG